MVIIVIERIEFMGLPGVGKSTSCEIVFNELKKKQNIHLFESLYQSSLKNQIKEDENFVRYLRYKLINITFKGRYNPLLNYVDKTTDFMIKNNAVFLNILNTIKTSTTPERGKYILRYLLMDIYKWELIRESNLNEHLVIMDEGFVQRVLTIYMFSDNKVIDDDLRSFFSIVGLPKVVINLRINIEELLNRMEKRKRGIPEGFRIYSNSELKEVLLTMNKFSEKLVLFLEKEGTKVIQIDNNNLDITNNKIIAEITSL